MMLIPLIIILLTRIKIVLQRLAVKLPKEDLEKQLADKTSVINVMLIALHAKPPVLLVSVVKLDQALIYLMKNALHLILVVNKNTLKIIQ